MAAESPGPLTALIQGTTVVPKAVAKFIDTVGDQLGFSLKAWHICRQGRAEASVRIEHAKADAEIALIKTQNDLAIQDIRIRAAERTRKKEERRQKNVEKIAKDACDLMPEEVSDTPVEQDWTTQFFEQCQDISDEQMQSVWSKILAGEIARPGSYSLRTLSLVRELSKRDAEHFNLLGTAIWRLETQFRPFIFDISKLDKYPEMAINPPLLFALEEAGLIRMAVPNFSKNFPPNTRAPIQYGDRIYVLGNSEKTTLHTGAVDLTTAGQELAGILSRNPVSGYHDETLRYIRAQGWSITDYDPTVHELPKEWDVR